MPANDIENSGTCVRIDKSALSECSVAFCTKSGYAAVCVDLFSPFRATTCGAYASRVDGGRRAACSPCGKSNCATPAFTASDGKAYCRRCELEYSSCRSGFQVFGPVAPGVTPDGAKCSSTDRTVPACKTTSTCLLNNFGAPGSGGVLPLYSTGKCVPDGKFATCSIAFCTGAGQWAYCRTPLERVATRCGAWASRTDFGYKPDCRILCPRGFCLPTGPVDKAGKKWCTPCHLRVASCESSFAISGYIAPLFSPLGALCSTNNPRNGERKCQAGMYCLITQFGYPLGGYANSGMCVTKSPWLPNCTLASCPPTETTKKCRTVDTMDVTTCKFWRTRSDGGQ